MKVPPSSRGASRLPTEVTIRPATPADADAILRLLHQAELPAAGVLDQFPYAYVLARRDGEIAGVAGLEMYGTSGLLRSMAVAPALRRSGIGRTLVADRLTTARERGLDAVYLLTTTAAQFFQRLGFSPMLREEVPRGLARSPEFAHACPDAATCMVLQVRT